MRTGVAWSSDLLSGLARMVVGVAVALVWLRLVGPEFAHLQSWVPGGNHRSVQNAAKCTARRGSAQAGARRQRQAQRGQGVGARDQMLDVGDDPGTWHVDAARDSLVSTLRALRH